jgi:hypothetical protein
LIATASDVAGFEVGVSLLDELSVLLFAHLHAPYAFCGEESAVIS